MNNITLLIHLPNGEPEDHAAFQELLREKLAVAGATQVGVQVFDPATQEDSGNDCLMRAGPMDMDAIYFGEELGPPHFELLLHPNDSHTSEWALDLIETVNSSPAKTAQFERADKLLDIGESIDPAEWPGFNLPSGQNALTNLREAAHDALSSGVVEKLQTFAEKTGVSCVALSDSDFYLCLDFAQDFRIETGRSVTSAAADFSNSQKLLTSIAKQACDSMGVTAKVRVQDSDKNYVQRPLEASDLPATAPEVKKTVEREPDRLTAEQAKAQMVWQSLGQTDGVKTHALRFYETADDLNAKRGQMNYGTVTKGNISFKHWSVDGSDESFDDLRKAKEVAEDLAIGRLINDGYVQAPTLETEKTTKPTPSADEPALSF